MKSRIIGKSIAVLAALLASSSLYAATVYIGSYNVSDGPEWFNSPPVYSALQAAELVFGPAVGGTYSISINGNDVNNISHTGWYAQIGIGPGVFAEGFSKDLGPPGYAGDLFFWTAGDDISAYVNDPFFQQGQGTNYVFFTPIPIPAAAWLLASGLGVMGWMRRKVPA